MRIVSSIIFFLLLFFVNLFFVKSRFKNSEHYNVPLNVLFNNGKNIRKRLCHDCFYTNEVNLIYKSCKAIENVNYSKFNKSKILHFIHQSPKIIKKYVTVKAKYKLDILSPKYIKTIIEDKLDIFFNGMILMNNTYNRHGIILNFLNFFRTLLFRFITMYLLQICTSFFLFHYFNIISQKTQSRILYISGSKYVSRIIGFLQLNLVNYYINVLSEVIQLVLLRILFNKYEVQLIKTILYNSADYFINKSLKNSYEIMYQCAKKLVVTKFNKLSLFTFNYLRYFVLTNLFFKLFNGSYNKFSPSDVKMPGVYSNPRKSIEKDMTYATKREIDILRNYCKETGCHTCGAVCYDKFIGDHQPPIQVVKDTIEYYKKKRILLFFLKLFKLYDTKQRLYPQCLRCSQLQSASVRCKKLKLIPHYNTIRIFHLSTVFHLFLKMLLLTKWKKIIFWDGDNVD
ncbi:conserved protein, unknown function [Plasmodium chabaudi chabaudi]|uniref:Uncharacterized protein n=1 Tax=Plasmodium chabaudi chabaudi TaxID=31271 RepID=A0A4V0K544_PLACU|nr:conserved protein, unknown function [Plasmodium chabaudi chabaudi]VTZ68063.1 conserved protein, unknown function [Plasmodium chabaudi chabaudi]|eukprot:XP_016653623.1 conserved Plasmodium protein, unknown function [Plasmodium chabaudi chabaudi]